MLFLHPAFVFTLVSLQLEQLLLPTLAHLDRPLLDFLPLLILKVQDALLSH